MKEHFSIAIDGPGGAGKSTLAKAVAKKLNILHVDTATRRFPADWTQRTNPRSRRC